MTIATELPDTFIPGEIPDSVKPVPPSVWGPGDVHHTHEQVWDESPAGVQAANTPDPRDLEIMRLNALIAGQTGADAKDQEIARLKAQLSGDTAATPTDFAAPVEAVATVVDPRDAELAALKAQVAAEPSVTAPPVVVPTTATPGDVPATPVG